METKYSIRELVNLPQLQALFEEFSRSTGFTTGLVSFPAQELLIATGWRDICVKFHRACPKAAGCCKESNIHLTACLKQLKELNIKPCGNGLVDGATPVIIRGTHMASLATGQVLLAPPDIDFHRKLAKEYGYDEEAYLAALAKVPVVSEEQLKGVLKFLSGMAVQMGEEGLRSLQLQETRDALQAENEHNKLTDEKVRESELRFRAVVEQAGDGFELLDEDGLFLDVNEATCRQMGYSREELLCLRVPDIDPVVDWQQFLSTFPAMEKSPVTFETVHKRRDGTRFPVEITASVIRIGNQRRLISLVRDISNRKRAELELQASNERLHLATEASRVGIWEWNVITNKIRWDNQMFEIYGIAPTQDGFIAYSTWSGAVLPEDLPRQEELLQDTIRRGGHGNREFRIQRVNDGECRLIEAIETVRKDDLGQVEWVVGTNLDVTERRQMEAKLLRSERMESLGTLASGVAHDLNNILTPIILATEMLHTEDAPPIRESLLKSISECARRGANVVNQVLTFARGNNKGERKTLQLSGIVGDMEKFMVETFPRSITITRDIPSDLWHIRADPTQLHQVLLNLCINARDAMPEGGNIFIKAENAEIDEHFASMMLNAKAGDYVALSIIDTGIGIPQKIINKIFDPFFTTKAMGKGTGLGLSTTLGIVRSHGGFISVKSDPGHGAAFKVFLPRQREEPTEQSQVVNTEFLRGNGETILLVEDEELIARAAVMVLERNGYKGLTATNGAEGLALYVKHVNEIDLVITDIMMPVMNGLQLSRSIKKINPQANVIASTGRATELQEAELHALGVHVILRKPYMARTLLATLHAALHGQG